MIKDDVKDFINKRCVSYATNIETIINSLIKHHDFPEELFDMYLIGSIASTVGPAVTKKVLFLKICDLFKYINIISYIYPVVVD